MKILDLKDLKNLKDNTCVTLGFFDGMHLGHQKILSVLSSTAKENDLKSLVITFAEDVLNLFKMTKSIVSIEEKLSAIASFNIDYVLVLKVTDNFMGLSAIEFKEQVLDMINTKYVICGSDFSFARKKEGNIDFLRNNSNYNIIQVDDVIINGDKVSSTFIRNLISNGNVDKANQLLFKSFSINSSVENGLKIGRNIGFKTANLKITDSCYLLKQGVYFGYVSYNNIDYKAMINVGINPTINLNDNLKIEAHILDFSEEIYNEKISLTFLTYYREEKKFENLDELRNQLSIDAYNLKKFN